MTEVEALEQQRANNETLIERAARAERLALNPDFKELILKTFMVDECAAYAHASANVSLDPTARADALQFAQGSGILKRWLQVVVQMGRQAENQLSGIDDALLEARQEAGE